MKRLSREFFLRPTLKVAQELLGKVLVRKYQGKLIKGIIVETEAYIGPKDKASHAYQNKLTKRNIVEYFLGGFCYLYLIYGMYWQLNITTSLANRPECVLLRAVFPLSKKENFVDGPGKLCQYFKLDQSFYGEDLVFSKRLWLEDWKIKFKNSEIKRKPRVGIDYAGPYWSKIKWRFLVEKKDFLNRISLGSEVV